MKIALLYGSQSCEHEISILSTLQIMKYFKNDEIILIYMSKDNKFYISKHLKEYDFYRNINLNKCKEITFINKNHETFIKIKHSLKTIPIDMIFPILHGSYGEDGCIQGYLEILNIPYAQSNLTTCALCIDKELTKKICEYNNIPILEYEVFKKQQVLSNLDSIHQIKIEKPWIIKPARLGSSIGINVMKETDINKMIDSLKFDHKIIVEHKLSNKKEYNIAILGDEYEQILSNIEQVQVSEDYYSYTDKYGGSTVKQQPTTRILSPDLEYDLENKIKEIALKAFKVFNCKGVVRFDFLIDEKIYLNEINVIPGSYSIYLFKNIIEPTQIIEILKNISLNEYKKRNQNIKTLDSNIFKKNWNQYQLKK